MIIRREHYAELSWWEWTRLRGMLAWARFTGGFARSLGLENSGLIQPTSVQQKTATSVSTCSRCGALGHQCTPEITTFDKNE